MCEPLTSEPKSHSKAKEKLFERSRISKSGWFICVLTRDMSNVLDAAP